MTIRRLRQHRAPFNRHRARPTMTRSSAWISKPPLSRTLASLIHLPLPPIPCLFPREQTTVPQKPLPAPRERERADSNATIRVPVDRWRLDECLRYLSVLYLRCKSRRLTRLGICRFASELAGRAVQKKRREAIYGPGGVGSPSSGRRGGTETERLADEMVRAGWFDT